MPQSPSPSTSRSPSPLPLYRRAGGTPLLALETQDRADHRKAAPARRPSLPAAGAPGRASAQDILPLHARVRAGLYAGVDHLTFRGTLTALLSGALKLAVSAVAGRDVPLRGTVWLGAAGSGLQALAGACLPGDREHGFSWVGTLAPSPALEPPPTVVQWRLLGTDQDQRRLQARLDSALLDQHRSQLPALQSQLKRSLSSQRDFNDFLSASIAAGLLLIDGLVANQAHRSAEEGEIGRSSYQAILMLTAVSLLLDFFACRWQMGSRQPDPASYPKPPSGPVPTLLLSPRPGAAPAMTPPAAAAGASLAAPRREAWGEAEPFMHYTLVDASSAADEDSPDEGLSEDMFLTRSAHRAADRDADRAVG